MCPQMYRVWIKNHELPIGANSQETVDKITEAFGEENIVLVEK